MNHSRPAQALAAALPGRVAPPPGAGAATREPWYSHFHPVYGEAYSGFFSRLLRITAVCYVSIAISAYEVFPCRHVLGEKLMAKNVDAECGGTSHKADMLVGTLTFAAIVVGFPLAVVVHLYASKKRYGGLHTPHLLARFGSFYGDYRNDVQVYWYGFETTAVVGVCLACVCFTSAALSVVLTTTIVFVMYLAAFGVRPYTGILQTAMAHDLYCCGLMFCAGSVLLLEDDGSRTTVGDKTLGELYIHCSVALWFYALRHSFTEFVELGVHTRIDERLEAVFDEPEPDALLPRTPRASRLAQDLLKQATEGSKVPDDVRDAAAFFRKNRQLLGHLDDNVSRLADPAAYLAAVGAALEPYVADTSPLSAYSSDRRASYWCRVAAAIPNLLHYATSIDDAHRAHLFQAFRELQVRESETALADVVLTRFRGPLLHALLSAPPAEAARIREYALAVVAARPGDVAGGAFGAAVAVGDGFERAVAATARAMAPWARDGARASRRPAAMSRDASVASLNCSRRESTFSALEDRALSAAAADDEDQQAILESMKAKIAAGVADRHRDEEAASADGESPAGAQVTLALGLPTNGVCCRTACDAGE